MTQPTSTSIGLRICRDKSQSSKLRWSPHWIIEQTCDICNMKYKQREDAFVRAKWKTRCKHHRKIMKICPDCGKNIWYGSKKCKSCSQIKPPRKCKQCKTNITRQSKTGYCPNCYADNFYGNGSERGRFQNSKRWKEVRQECFKRDNFTCRLCRLKSPKYLNAHHIKSWRLNIELRLNLSNLITLCKECHKNVHMKGIWNAIPIGTPKRKTR